MSFDPIHAAATIRAISGPYLTNKFPDWHNKIDIDKIEMAWANHCVLGMASNNNYDEAVDKLPEKRQSAVCMYFTLDDESNKTRNWADLGHVWKEYILELRSVDFIKALNQEIARLRSIPKSDKEITSSDLLRKFRNDPFVKGYNLASNHKLICEFGYENGKVVALDNNGEEVENVELGEEFRKMHAEYLAHNSNLLLLLSQVKDVYNNVH